MFFDLSVPWTENHRELQRTVAFLDELGYNVIALTHTLAGKLPSDLTSPIPRTLPFPTPPRLRVLRRCNLLMTDHTANHLIPKLQQQYDIIAARPTNDRTLQQACSNLDVDIISLDLTNRFEKPFKFPMLGAAIARGIKIELCYSQALTDNQHAKRSLISNATQLIRVSRGRGILLSSEARSVLTVRAPSDVINLASVWGLGREKGKDGLSREAHNVVEFARLKRTSYRGVVDVVYGGEEPPAETPKTKGQKAPQVKRKADKMEGVSNSKAGEKKPKAKQQSNAGA